MPLVADRVKETTVNPSSTATITLAGAVSGFQGFGTVFSVGERVIYAITGTGTEWEAGYGIVASSTTLTRSEVTANSAGTAPTLLTFSAGTYDVFNTITAARHFDLITKSRTHAMLSGLVLP